ncbi:hypothetical protein CRUP_015850 [Coryphaenoides rupestris]|nr:hypothetical protein CRUP_015850 [Coryphaenoides rupestris]
MAGRDRIAHLLRQLSRAACRCPAHSNTDHQGAGSAPCTVRKTDYAFEMASSNIRYGEGVTREIGMDLQNMGARNVCLMTDRNLAALPPVQSVLESLAHSGVNYQVFDKVRVEPTDSSFKEAIAFARNDSFDVYVAVGGGSVIDTCKAANLYASHPEAEFLDFVNAPIGKGLPVTGVLKPLIAGIASRALKPTLGMVDPLHTLHMPERVAANSGFDVLCHSLESYTALPYNMRKPCPPNPIQRPAYQGSNPISDVWSRHALTVVAKFMKRAVRDPEDLEARSSMHLASVFAGIGFGNAGVHLCHGMSYPIAGNVKTHRARGYNVDHPIVVEDGLSAVGYTQEDVPDLVKGTIPQERVTKLSPREHTEEDLTRLFEASLKLY